MELMVQRIYSIHGREPHASHWWPGILSACLSTWFCMNDAMIKLTLQKCTLSHGASSSFWNKTILSILQLIASEAAPAPQQINNSPFAVRECLIQRGPTKHGLHMHATSCQGRALGQSLYYHINWHCSMLIGSCVMKFMYRSQKLQQRSARHVNATF